jgi:hypothetical protein
MGSRRSPGRILRATLCEIERGLFHVSYRSDVVEWDVHELPAYQVGASAVDAKQRIEARAQGCGFETVLWEYALVVPTSMPDPTGETAPPPQGIAAGS